MNGMNTINQDTTPKPAWHKKFNKMLNITDTHSFKNAVLYSPLYVSMTTCVKEKNMYINAGGHNFSKAIIYLIYLVKKQFSVT